MAVALGRMVHDLAVAEVLLRVAPDGLRTWVRRSAMTQSLLFPRGGEILWCSRVNRPPGASSDDVESPND
jgi:hypothetical protein